MNFNPGDIVTIETGVKGQPGYQLETWKAGHVGAPGGASYGRISCALDCGWTIVSIDRAKPDLPEKPGTIGIATDDLGVRRVLTRTADAGAPWESLRPCEWFNNERDLSAFIETCPYVPADLIREAEEWSADSAGEAVEAVALLTDILEAVRKHRREVEGDE